MDKTIRVSIWEGNKASLCNARFNKIFRQKLQEYADKQIDANTIVNLDEDIVLK